MEGATDIRERSMAEEKRQGEITVCFHWSWRVCLNVQLPVHRRIRSGQREWVERGLRVEVMTLHGLLCGVHAPPREGSDGLAGI